MIFEVMLLCGITKDPTVGVAGEEIQLLDTQLQETKG